MKDFRRKINGNLEMEVFEDEISLSDLDPYACQVLTMSLNEFDALIEEYTFLRDYEGVCQVGSRVVRDHLGCRFSDSGGVLCEREFEHAGEHWVSEHTVLHSLSGNGYACDSFIHLLSYEETKNQRL